MILPKQDQDSPSVKHQLVAERNAHNQTRHELKRAIAELNLAKEEIRVLTADLKAAQLTITDLETSATVAAETTEDNKARVEREKQDLQNTLDNLANKPKAQLEQEKRDLEEEKREIQIRLDDSEMLVRRLMEEKENLNVENEALQEEKSILALSIDELSREKQETLEEKGQLATKHDTLLQENDDLIGLYNQLDHKYHREIECRERAEQEARRAWSLHGEIEKAEAEIAMTVRLLSRETELRRQAEADAANSERDYRQERRQRLMADEDVIEARQHHNSYVDSRRVLLADMDNEIQDLRAEIRAMVSRPPTRTRITGTGYSEDDMLGSRMTANGRYGDTLTEPSRRRYRGELEGGYRSQVILEGARRYRGTERWDSE